MNHNESTAIKVAAIQCALSDHADDNIALISKYVREAAASGAQIILPSELFAGHYFCKTEEEEFFARAQPVENNPLLRHFQKLAKELAVVLPISFFERQGQAYYNSVAVIDATGDVLGIYRKSHIPDGPGYEEKFYFRPGDTGFKVWQTKYAKIGVGICWDQWFPECARAMVLQGADLLFYPTAIGSEPANPSQNTKNPWQRAMIGHGVCNVVPIIAANRIGKEGDQTFYGHSFIANPDGDLVAELGAGEAGVISHSFDIAVVRKLRASWGFFRDRRPELYNVLVTADGVTNVKV